MPNPNTLDIKRNVNIDNNNLVGINTLSAYNDIIYAQDSVYTPSLSTQDLITTNLSANKIYSSCGNSEEWCSAFNTLTSHALDARYVNLTGDTMTGALSTPSLSTDNLFVSTNMTTDGTNHWSGGRVHYLPLGTDINAYIASDAVVDGDTIELASGTYTPTSYINFTKGIHLRGQGRQHTILSWLDSAEAIRSSQDLPQIEVSNLHITCSAEISSSIVDFISPHSDTDFRDIDVTLDVSSAGTERLNVFNAISTPGPATPNAILLRLFDTNIVSTGAVGRLAIIYVQGSNNSSVIAERLFIDVSNVTDIRGWVVNNVTGSIVLRDCNITADNNTTDGIVRTIPISANIYGGYINATGTGAYDLEGDWTIHRPITLANGTINGTNTYVGTTVTNDLCANNSYTVDWHYFSTTWRQGVSGDDLLVQKYDGADWVTKGTFT